MSKVHILSDRVANQIAAGEVIERPAAVVKELVENALDAGASRVEVEFRHGGRSLIRVEDNGGGMSRDDALLALERHATSKISEATDLDRLASYGFRGEALPSIASVSRFLLQTREHGSDAGTEVLVNGGKFVHVRDCGRPVGTRVEVTYLFNSVPARRKFLKTDQTEAAHIVHNVRLYALACPAAAFTLIEDGRTIFRSPQCTTLAERIAEIFGRQIAEGLIDLNASEASQRITGLVGRPGIGRATRHEMIVFVNARPVDSRTLNYALIESYHESLPKGRYPLAFVFYECDPAAVDVNVHPAKREVRFRAESEVRGFVIRAVLRRLREYADSGLGSSGLALGGSGRVPSPRDAPGAMLGAFPAISRSDLLRASVPSGGTPPAACDAAGSELPPQHRGGAAAPPISPASRTDPAMSGRAPAASGQAESSSVPRDATPNAGPMGTEHVLPRWRYLGFAHGMFAVFETGAGLVLLDLRAAHERVWFERLRAQFRAGAVPSQRLLLPAPVELDSIATALLLDRREFLKSHGFEIAEFGRNFFRIEGIPGWMEPTDAEAFVRDVIGGFRDGSIPDGNVELAHEELARRAAAKAVRIPKNPGETELRALVGELLSTRTPLTSPAGRPTYIELDHAELTRRFQRNPR